MLGKVLAINNPVCEGGVFDDPGAVAVDNIDGDVSEGIVTGGDFPVDTSVLGIQIITYDVSDNAGNEALQKTRKVNVISSSEPECEALVPPPPQPPPPKDPLDSCFSQSSASMKPKTVLTSTHQKQRKTSPLSVDL